MTGCRAIAFAGALVWAWTAAIAENHPDMQRYEDSEGNFVISIPADWVVHEHHEYRRGDTRTRTTTLADAAENAKIDLVVTRLPEVVAPERLGDLGSAWLNKSVEALAEHGDVTELDRGRGKLAGLPAVQRDWIYQPHGGAPARTVRARLALDGLNMVVVVVSIRQENAADLAKIDALLDGLTLTAPAATQPAEGSP